jgi:peptidoglycan hydrolase FlgJ
MEPLKEIKNNNILELTGSQSVLARSSAPKKGAEEAATEFESLLLKQMLSEMWESVPKEGLLSGGRAEEMYYDLYHQSVADSISQGGGIGIKEELLDDMLKTEDKRRNNSSK